MTYDYSIGFLHKNAELVKKLIRVATSGEIIAWDFTEWNKLRYAHQTVLSLLANISRNDPAWADIRKQVRCWTETMDDGSFRLNVGTPNHKLTGRPPGTKNDDWKSAYVPASDVTGMVYKHPDVLSSENNDTVFPRFCDIIRALPASYKRAELRMVNEGLDDPSAVEEWFRDFFSNPLYGTWKPSLEGTTLVVERP